MLPRCSPTLVVTLALLACALSALADDHVAVTAFAKTEYTRRKFENDQPRTETYVFMQGRFVEGRRNDHSLDRMTFRQLAEFLAPELARQQYLPTPDLKSADLVLVVHWGTTQPYQDIDPIRTLSSVPTKDEVAREADIARMNDPESNQQPSLDGMENWNVSGSEPYRQLGAEQLDQAAEMTENDLMSGNNTRLLGYTRDLNRLGQSAFQTTAESTLRSDLATERYFIIIKAYDLKDPRPKERMRRPVWTLHLNIRSPGQNFATALAQMGNVAVDYFGRNTDSVETARPHERTGTVTLHDVKILGEVAGPDRAK